MITTAKDLRVRTKAILEAVARGEEVIVTHRGRACARILPASSTKKQQRSATRKSAAPLFGIWKDDKKKANVTAYVDKLRKGRDI